MRTSLTIWSNECFNISPNRQRVTTRKYNLFKLVYFEPFANIRDAIGREKQIKGWLPSKKVALIESVNPDWKV